MSDMAEFELEDPNGTPTNSDWANARKRFQEEKSAREAAEATATAKEREIAFLRAGIDPADPKMTYFMAGYSGDVTPEAIKETAIRDGFLTAGAPPAAPDPARAAAAQQQAAIDSASAGAIPPDSDLIAGIDDAYAKGGDAAVEEALRAQGIPIRYSS